MKRRQQVIQAVRGPVSSGSRHCVNVLKELLPQEAIQEIHGQVSAGVNPLQAVETVTQQRMGPQAAADVTKLFVAVSLASSAGGGVVQAAKGLLCLLAKPLFLRGPMQVLTNVLLPTPVAGSLLGCCLVLHTARELLHSNGSQQQHKQQLLARPTAAAAAAAPEGAEDTAVDEIGAGAEKEGASKPKRQGHAWWPFWQHSSQPKAQSQPQQQQQQLDSSAAAAAAAAVASDSMQKAKELSSSSSSRSFAEEEVAGQAASPAGPVTPDHSGPLIHSSSSSREPPAAVADAGADANAAAAAAMAAVAPGGAFGGSDSKQRKTGSGPAAHPLPGSSLWDLDTCSSSDEGCGSDGVAGTAASTASKQAAAAAAAAGVRAAPLPLSRTHSLRATAASSAAAAETAAAEEEEEETAAEGASPRSSTPTPSFLNLLRRRSSSGAAGEFAGLEPLSPTLSSGPHSPREEIEEQAAEVQRRWSMGQHDDMIPHPRSFQMVQQQPYRPPVFTRLSSGRGGCRITAAAAAAAAREQHAAKRAQQGAGGGGEPLRRYHSLDIRREGSGEQGVVVLGQGVAAAAAAGGVSGGVREAGAGGSGAAHSAHLPPLPSAAAREHGEHQQQQQQAGGLLGQASGLHHLLQPRGVVKQRSLDLGHKLYRSDSVL